MMHDEEPSRLWIVVLILCAMLGLWGTGEYIALGRRTDEIRILTMTVDTQHREAQRLRGMLEEAMVRGGCFLPLQQVDLTKVWFQRGGEALLAQEDGGWSKPEKVVTVFPPSFICGLVQRGFSKPWARGDVDPIHWECVPAPDGLTAADMETAHE